VNAGRFAPSPTGVLHVGNLRTALAAWGSCVASGNEFLVRFEDLDRVTSSVEMASGQLADLAALGIPVGEGHWFQSERFSEYHAAIDSLVARGLTYECYCSRREIREAAAAPHDGQFVYPGTCRDLSVAEREERRRERPGALRLRGSGGTEAFHDVLHGDVTGLVDDVVLRRNDGVPSYNVAVVVDDAAQGVVEVVRGDDLLPVTASQVHLQRLLGLPTPVYGHVPLVLGDDGERLAKRHGAVTLADLVVQGHSAIDVRARLWESLGQEEGSAFSWDLVPREPWVWSI